MYRFHEFLSQNKYCIEEDYRDVHLLGKQISLLVFDLRLVAGRHFRRAKEEHVLVSEPQNLSVIFGCGTETNSPMVVLE